MTWALAGNLEIKASYDKGSGFQAFTAKSGHRLCGLLRCVDWFVCAANLRCASTRKSEDAKMKAYGAPTVLRALS
jgi:hypothetical protein